VSFLRPDGPFDSGVIESFCHFVHFFASRRAGEQWVAGHPGTFLLTLGEAADLAPHAATSGCSRTPWGHADGQDSPGAGTSEASKAQHIQENRAR